MSLLPTGGVGVEKTHETRMQPTERGCRDTLVTRESGLELLRIIAIIMVTAHHFVLYNALDVWSAPLDAKRLFFETAFLGMGKIGVVCFFGITAWFLCERKDGYRRMLRRVWIMERELLFYSVGIYLIARFLLHAPMPDGTGWKAVTPLSSGLWWYPTSYATFLLLCPALTAGLRAAEEAWHRRLAFVCTALWGFVQGVPRSSGVDGSALVYFFVLYVVISYYRWYMRPLRSWVGPAMVATGLFVIAASAPLFALVVPGDAGLQTYLSGEWKLPVSLTGLGLLLSFSRFKFRSSVINWVAESTFVVYLVTEFPGVRSLLWKGMFSMEGWYALHSAPFIAALCVVVVITACVAIDAVRRALFATLLRRPGAWFDALWDASAPLRDRLMGRVPARGASFTL